MSKENSKGVEFIIKHDKLPDYIRNHEVFKKIDKIAKVFPGIGLPNCSEEFSYGNLIETKQDAANLVYNDIRGQFSSAYYNDKWKNSPYRGALYELMNQCVSHNTIIVEENQRLSCKIYRDILLEGKPLFRQGESLFKVYNKVREKCAELNIVIAQLEDLPYFKVFSTSNVPGGKKYKIVFSSSGDEGVWDLATISMRGFTSCQTWGSTQSRGLIGSISSKFVGVVYITDGKDYNNHGAKMHRRALVRFCVHKETKKPALLVDRVYPGDDRTSQAGIREFLNKKTNLPVLFPGDAEWTKYYLPNDSFFKDVTFQPGELTYMDTKIPWKSAITPTTPDFSPYYTRLAQLDNELHRDVHNEIVQMLNEYTENKTAHKNLFKGGGANLLLSIKDHSGVELYASYILPKTHYYVANLSTLNLSTLLPRPEANKTAHEYEKDVIRKLYSQLNTVFEKRSFEQLKAMGKWTQCYPNSLDKYIKLVFSVYRKHLLKRYQVLLRN